MSEAKGHRKLRVWEASMVLTEQTYILTALLPSDERYGLSSQMKRCAASVPSNIAEGYGRTHLGDYLKHLSYARGSLLELQTQLEIAVRVKLLERDQVRAAWKTSHEAARMLTALIGSLEAKRPGVRETGGPYLVTGNQNVDWRNQPEPDYGSLGDVPEISVPQPLRPET